MYSPLFQDSIIMLSQANPLNHKKEDIHMLGGSRGMLAAHQPLVVPMLLRLSHFVLNAYVVLVVSKQKGITLVFKTDPLQNVDVNSTFDSIAVIQKYIQREIEGQLREMFRDDLPGIIHRLSQRWVAGKTKVETPYLFNKQRQQQPQSMSNPDIAAGGYYPSLMPGFHPTLRRQSMSRMPSLQHLHNIPPAPHSAPHSAPSAIATSPLNATRASPEPPTTFPDIENFDPTYGLRPDDLPAKSGYSGFGRLFGAPQGLKDLTEEATEGDIEWNERESFDMVDWEETVSFTPPPSVVSEEAPEYETIPAVGGGTITRPRIYHSQSIIRPPVDSESSSAATITNRTETPIDSHPDIYSQRHDSIMFGISTPVGIHNPFFPSWPGRPGTRRGQALPHWMSQPDAFDFHSRLTHSARAASLPNVPGIGMMSLGLPFHPLPSDRSFPTSSSEGTGSHLSRSSSAQTREPFTPPPSDAPHQDPPHTHLPKGSNQHNRRRSVSPAASQRSSDGMPYGSPPHIRSTLDADGNIVLRPGLNTISKLSTLSHSNHTLSPYTRSLEHFTVRSVPHRVSGAIPAGDRRPVKARRKRTYHLGGQKPPPPLETVAESRTASSSPPPPSEFEVSDVEHYFHVPHTSLRRRASYRTS